MDSAGPRSRAVAVPGGRVAPPGRRAPNDLRLYDDLVGEWWDPRGAFSMLHWIAAARARLIPRASRAGAVLLDLGCGGGLLAPHVAGMGYLHVGVDLTVSALAQARAHGVRTVRADVARLPLPDGCADVVSAGEILEHVPDPDACVAEACRVLRPGGRLVLDTIAATAFARFVVVTVGEGIGAAPRGVHDPALFVDRDRLVAVAAEHGVRLRLRGIRPAVSDLVRWRFDGRDAAEPPGSLRPPRTVRMVPTFSTALLFQGYGVKEPARRGDAVDQAVDQAGVDQAAVDQAVDGLGPAVTGTGVAGASVPAHPLAGRGGREGAGAGTRW